MVLRVGYCRSGTRLSPSAATCSSIIALNTVTHNKTYVLHVHTHTHTLTHSHTHTHTHTLTHTHTHIHTPVEGVPPSC